MPLCVLGSLVGIICSYASLWLGEAAVIGLVVFSVWLIWWARKYHPEEWVDTEPAVL